MRIFLLVVAVLCISAPIAVQKLREWDKLEIKISLKKEHTEKTFIGEAYYWDSAKQYGGQHAN